VNDVLTELHVGPSGGHLGVYKTLNKIWQSYYWIQVRHDVEKWCRQRNTFAASCGPPTGNWGQMHQYKIEAPFEKIAINVAGPFPWSEQGNQYLLIAMNYFTKWPKAYAVPNQGASAVAEALVTNFFCHFRVLWELQRPGP
jgi:hypothetical protein